MPVQHKHCTRTCVRLLLHWYKEGDVLSIAGACLDIVTYGEPFDSVAMSFYDRSQFYKLFMYEVFEVGLLEACSGFGISAELPELQKLEPARNRLSVQHGDGSAVKFVQEQCMDEILIAVLDGVYTEQLAMLDVEHGLSAYNFECSTTESVFQDVDSDLCIYSILKQVVHNKDIDYWDYETRVIGSLGGERHVFEKAYVKSCGGSLCEDVNGAYAVSLLMLSNALQNGVSSMSDMFSRIKQAGQYSRYMHKCMDAIVISGIEMNESQAFSKILRKVASKNDS